MAAQAARAQAKAPAAAAHRPMLRRVAEPLQTDGPRPLASLALVPAAPAVQRKCASCESEEKDEMPVQPRLEVGPVGDRYEQEADTIAGRVMAMRDSDVSPAAAGVQRVCSACSSEDLPRARRMAEVEGEEEEEKVRARRDAGSETIAASDSQLTSGGSPLPTSTRGFFEGRLGRDLGDVRVHQGGGSQAFNESISARAFTYKNHIWLGANENAGPSFTMAHELAHVMQQTAPGPVGPQAAGQVAMRADRSLEDGQGMVRRTDSPFFMPGSSPRPSNATMHKVAQGAIRGVNSDLLTEVPMPGANRKVISTEKCGFADFYTADPNGPLIPVPGLEVVETPPATASGTPTVALNNFDERSSKASCVTFMGSVMRGAGDYTAFDRARAPVLGSGGRINAVGRAPTNIKVGELKPAHDIDYRGDGVVQVANYLAGLNRVISETNGRLGPSAGQWNGSPKKMTSLKLPPGWDAKGNATASDWPIRDLKIRSYKTVLRGRIGKKKKTTRAKTFRSGSSHKIFGRWMLAKDSTRRKRGDGVFVYFLAPNPDDLAKVLADHKTTLEFKNLAKHIVAIQTPLLTAPDVKHPRKRPASPQVRRLPRVVTVRRKAVDTFNRKEWELKRTGSFGKETKSGSLAEEFANAAPEELQEQMEESAGIADWVRTPPDEPEGIKYDKTNAKVTDPVTVDFNTMRKAAFWSSPLAAPFGVLRERLGGLFVKGYAAFEKVKKKIRSLFKGAKFKTQGSSSIGKHAVKIVGKVFAQLGKVVLARTAMVIGQCLQAGLTAFIQEKIGGEVEDLIKKAQEAEAYVEHLKEEIEAKIKARLEETIGKYEETIKKIADDAKIIAAIAGAVSEIVRIARMLFCASGLAAAGWGAIVTCLLSIADWIASKFDRSPLDWIIKKVMGSCRGRRLFAKALLAFEDVRKLPTNLALRILTLMKEVLPEPASKMVCDLGTFKVDDLSMADFECKEGGDGEGEGGDGSGEGDAEEVGEEGGQAGTEGDSEGGAGDKEGAGDDGGEGSESGSAPDDSNRGKTSGGDKSGGGTGSRGQGTSSVKGGTVEKGDPTIGSGFIETGIDWNRSYKNERVDVTMTVNLGEHILRDLPCTIVVQMLVDAQGGGKYAQFYFPEDLVAKQGTFEITVDKNDPSKNYKWSPKPGPTNAGRFMIRGSK